MRWSFLYVQVLISLAIALGTLILTIIDILPLKVLIGLVPILILLAILRNSIDHRSSKKSGVSTSIPSLEEFNFVDPPGYYTHPKYPNQMLCPFCLIKSKLIAPVSKIDEKAWYCNVCDKPLSGTRGGAFSIDW